jgi:hypothetical protein
MPDSGQARRLPWCRARRARQVPLLVARYAASGQLAPAVGAAVRVQQDSDAAVAAALALAAVLERIIVADDSVQARCLSSFFLFK